MHDGAVPAGRHAPRHQLAEVGEPTPVGGRDRIKFIQRQVQEMRPVEGGRVIDQHLDGTDIVFDAGNHPFQFRRPGDVRLHRGRRPAESCDLLNGLLRSRPRRTGSSLPHVRPRRQT